jgi:hypothetical protein
MTKEDSADNLLEELMSLLAKDNNLLQKLKEFRQRKGNGWCNWCCKMNNCFF